MVQGGPTKTGLQHRCSGSSSATPHALPCRRPAAGMHDAQDGPASSSAWIYSLYWEGKARFVGAQRRVVRARQVEEAGADGASASGTGPLLLPAAAGWEAAQQLPRDSGASRAAGSAPLSTDTATSKHRGGPGDAAVAYWKAGGGLTHVVLTWAGHMTPRDDPATTRWMLERWLAESVPASARAGSRRAADAQRREGGGRDLAAA